MSEVIVRMEMPKSCPCDLIGVGYDIYCSATSGIPKRFAEYDECVKNGTRPDWCPIIGELPEQHGELIDMRELLKRKMKMDWSVLEWVHEVDICAARVIVPATKGAKHE